MTPKIKRLLNGEEDNYIFPFFWQHGETEEVLRTYMEAIYNSNIRAVCIESRPHPDFCGPRWWRDLDIILDEAKKRDMKVWILDDSHFPTGYANGAVLSAPLSQRRQSIGCYIHEVEEGESTFYASFDKITDMPKSPMGKILDEMAGNHIPECQFTDDKILSVTISGNQKIPYSVEGDKLSFEIPKGTNKIYICFLTRNAGSHRKYINMMHKESCRILIDAVYEPHYARYANEFGHTIAGFFSDEPELGNGEMYNFQNLLGTPQDLPWSKELEAGLQEKLGKDYTTLLPLLWENDEDPSLIAKVRYTYMDCVTRLVEKNFSLQVGNWCREHGVEYIGHIIEDNNQHARTGSSLGHYFRGLAGQDMAGIDDIGGQVLPQGEDLQIKDMITGKRDGEFFHFALGKLGASYGAIDPLKKGRTMCEIFGNYGWKEGVRLESYLADHFMVRGVNRFVPHAFSGKEYPDPDCPPHFYAHGHNPQYRHFGVLMKYMNRICELISDGKTVTNIAILYHGEAEWTGKYMLMQKPARILAENQVDYHFIPIDVFENQQTYKTEIGERLSVNGNKYDLLLIPYTQFIPVALEKGIGRLVEAGCKVVFLEGLPEGLCDSDQPPSQTILNSQTTTLDEILPLVQELGLQEVKIQPGADRIRCLHYKGDTEIYYFVNEDDKIYTGQVTLPQTKGLYAYDAWNNRLLEVDYTENGDGAVVKLKMQPGESLILVVGYGELDLLQKRIQPGERKLPMKKKWTQGFCRSIDYPDFRDEEEISNFENAGEKKPEFSGYIRYENEFESTSEKGVILEITDAYEGVEVFVNGKSAGIQILPPFLYDISTLVNEGINYLRIEVATTLERERSKDPKRGQPKDQVITCGPTGITGEVNLYAK